MSTETAPNAATPAEQVQALKLPEHVAAGMVTHHLEGAIRSIELAEAAGRPDDKTGYAKRAEEHLLYARRNVESMLSSWRGYNEQADRLITRLAALDGPKLEDLVVETLASAGDRSWALSDGPKLARRIRAEVLGETA